MVRRLAVVALALLVLTPPQSQALEGALLQGPGSNGDWYAVGATGDVGQAWSFGHMLVLEDGEGRAVQLQSIELLGAQGLVIVDITVNGPKRTFNMIGALDGSPLPELVQDKLPTAGAVFPRHRPDRDRGLAVTFGVRRDEPGRGYATGFSVTYTADGRQFRQSFTTGFTLCAYPGHTNEQPSSVRCESVEDPRAGSIGQG